MLVDQDNRREARRQRLLLDRLEVQYRGAIAREIARATREMAEAYAITGEVPPATGHRQAMEAIFRRMLTGTITTFARRIVDQGKAAGLAMETKDFAAEMTAAALRYIQSEMIRQRIVRITNTTREQIVAQVQAGYTAGEGQREIAERIIERTPEIARYRANVIARTETHGGSQYGSMEAARQTGLVTQKQWLAADDERTRQSHRDAEDEGPIDMDSAFPVGDSLLQYPGDPAGAPEETINCRCVMTYVIPESAI